MKITTILLAFALSIGASEKNSTPPTLTAEEKLVIRDAQVAYLQAKATIEEAKTKADESLKALNETVSKIAAAKCGGCQITQNPQTRELTVVVPPPPAK